MTIDMERLSGGVLKTETSVKLSALNNCCQILFQQYHQIVVFRVDFYDFAFFKFLNFFYKLFFNVW